MSHIIAYTFLVLGILSFLGLVYGIFSLKKAQNLIGIFAMFSMTFIMVGLMMLSPHQ
jgi:hypothetical protein